MIHDKVGEAQKKPCKNRDRDVRVVQKVMNKRGDILTPLRLLVEDGKFGPGTLTAIRHVQAKLGVTADGVISPYGVTIRSLWPVAYFNPTGGQIRGADDHGSGEFGASRGKRSHDGTDYISTAGQQVFAPMSGIVTGISNPYRDGVDVSKLSGVEIWASDGSKAWIWYIAPTPGIVGSIVKAGAVIGQAVTLQNRYKGITDHVHVRVHNQKGLAQNPALLIR